MKIALKILKHLPLKIRLEEDLFNININNYYYY